MQMGHIVIISGSPGVGKSTVARILAENSPYERAIHIHTDDFYGYIRKGYIEPWKPESNEQNIAVSKAIVSCAKCFAENGYEVLVDGVIGTWFLNPWIELTGNEIDVQYAILRPSLEITVSRNKNRGKEIASDVITHMWNEFADLGLYEPHVIDTSNQKSEETVITVRNLLNGGRLHVTRL